jgi:hypothetical protein
MLRWDENIMLLPMLTDGMKTLCSWEEYNVFIPSDSEHREEYNVFIPSVSIERSIMFSSHLSIGRSIIFSSHL